MDTQEAPGKWKIRKVKPDVEDFCWEITHPDGTWWDTLSRWDWAIYNVDWNIRNGG